MTNLFATYSVAIQIAMSGTNAVTNKVFVAEFIAPEFTHCRLMRRAHPSVNTNWLGADSYEFQAFSQPVVLMDAFWTTDAWYEVIGLEVEQ